MYHIIVNPSAKTGLGRTKWRELKKILDAEKITYIVHFTKSAQDTCRYTRSITDPCLYKYNAVPNQILVLGGDGTLNCVINSILDPDHTFVTYLPAGTSNDFARALHISDLPEDAMRTIRRRSEAATDLGVVRCGHKKRKFAVSSGIGYDASICEEALRSPAKKVLNRLGLGKLTYVSIALKQLLLLKPISCDLYLDDKPPMHFHHFMFAAMMQQPYEGGGFKFCPKADATDGMLDICVAGNVSKFRVLLLIPLAVFGGHVGHRGIHSYRAKTVRIVTSRPLCIHTDGEIVGHYKELTATTDGKLFYYQ